MISPTGRGIRNDQEGMGHYGAARGGGRGHLGFDFKAHPFQDVVAPFDMIIDRVALPRAGSDLSGISWRTESMTGQMFYFLPNPDLIGCPVRRGQVIGQAQDLKQYYGPKIISHIHFEIESIDPAIIMKLTDITRGL